MDPKMAARRVWGNSPAGSALAPGERPGSRDYFETVRKRRKELEFPWLDSLIPFSSAAGKKVLEIGCGAGYDAYEFCRLGAFYSGIDLAPENILLCKRNLSYEGYDPEISEGDAEALPFGDESFNIVYSNGVLHHAPDIDRCFREAYRVLKRGGLFWVILYHKSSVFYWLTLFIFKHILRLGFLKMSFKKRLSMIEYNTAGAAPLVKAYTRRGLTRKLAKAGFQVEEVKVRKLNPEDLPLAKIFGKLYAALIPTKAWEWLGQRFGWYVIAKSVKS
ncbi:MAG: class I SAM-dependent methyltransferase [Firmicutes bacterium]|nr:class I SAM-dependent methyltransferase [Bacillota bacterium]